MNAVSGGSESFANAIRYLQVLDYPLIMNLGILS
jgi:hypothetical protein